MLSCRRASQLISEAMNRRLSLRERIALRFHVVACSACRTYRRQLALIRQAMQSHSISDVDSASEFTGIHLSSAARERIRQALQQHL